jgi:PAS domain S-box-containing protein
MTHSHTEEVLRASLERYRALIAAVARFMWTTDAHGQIIEDQPDWRGFTGQTGEQIRRGGWLAAVHPDSREGAASTWARAVVRGSPYETEWRVRRHDGDYRSFSIHAAPVRDQHGSVKEWVGCGVDVTDQRQREEELQRSYATANVALAQLSRQARDTQILKNLGDTLQACNSRVEAYPFIALAATELFPGASGALAVPVAGVRELLETATEWGGDSLHKDGLHKVGWMQPDFTIEDCWALRERGLRAITYGPDTSRANLPGPRCVCPWPFAAKCRDC